MGNIFTSSPSVSIEQLHEQFAKQYVYVVGHCEIYDVPIINKAHHLLLFISQHEQEAYFNDAQIMYVDSEQQIKCHYRNLPDKICYIHSFINDCLSSLRDIAKTHNEEVFRYRDNRYVAKYTININFDCRDLNCVIRDTANRKIEFLQQTLLTDENDYKQKIDMKLERDLHENNVIAEIAFLDTEMQQNRNQAKNADKKTKLMLVNDLVAKNAKMELLKTEQKEYASFCNVLEAKKKAIDECNKVIAKLKQLISYLDCADEQNSPYVADEKMNAVSVANSSNVTVIEPKDI